MSQYLLDEAGRLDERVRDLERRVSALERKLKPKGLHGKKKA